MSVLTMSSFRRSSSVIYPTVGQLIILLSPDVALDPPFLGLGADGLAGEPGCSDRVTGLSHETGCPTPR
jgi:hypothetical protein